MKQRLLIVDDEPGIVDMMASYFSSQYEVLTAYCGNEALQKLARQPDLILLDINMPDIDGLTLCQKIRELITCPILFLTARVESADKIIGFQAGADDYIIKPFDLDELGAKLLASISYRRWARLSCGVNTKRPETVWKNERRLRTLWYGAIQQPDTMSEAWRNTYTGKQQKLWRNGYCFFPNKSETLSVF